MPQGPDVWICGDCHVGNLGPVAGTDGKIAVEIRDLDQTVVGNPAHDLIRLGLSLAMAARGSDLPGVTTARMIERVVEGYEEAFAPAADDGRLQAERGMPHSIKHVMRQAARRSWKHLADERIEGIEPVIPLGKRFWPLTDPERKSVFDLFEDKAVRRLATSLRSREDGADVRVIDAAYWKKGCSSLGRLRMAVLVAIGHGNAKRHCLMDIKEAIKAAAPCSPEAFMPANDADRVVTGARALSPFLGDRMFATHLVDRSVFLRELLPQDLKFEFEHLTQDEAIEVAGYLAYVVGRSHARQLEASDKAAWMAELGRRRTRTLAAPSWLWDSVVDLVASHEAAYLNHCRHHALEPFKREGSDVFVEGEAA